MNKYFFFSKYDDGVKLDEEGWYSATPEPVAAYLAFYIEALKKPLVIDGCCSVGGNLI